MFQTTLIDGTTYEIRTGKTLIQESEHEIIKGRTLVDGTGFDILFGIPIGELPVGESVFIDINGKETEFLVVNQGTPSQYNTPYDPSCNGTWLLTKDIIGDKESDTFHHYSDSVLHKYLNGDFLLQFDKAVQDIIIDAKIPMSTSNNTEGQDWAKVFPLTMEELNYSHSLGTHKGLSYFANCPKVGASEGRIAYFDGTASKYYTRSVHHTNSYYIVDETGDFDQIYPGDVVGIRPAMIVPSETRVTMKHHRLIV